MRILTTASTLAAPDDGLSLLIDAAVVPFYKPNEPGATVIVTVDGTMMFRQAYGVTSVASQEAMTPEATMRLGSISKQFTAVAVLMLIEEGKLSLTDNIVNFFPDYPAHVDTQ